MFKKFKKFEKNFLFFYQTHVFIIILNLNIKKKFNINIF